MFRTMFAIYDFAEYQGFYNFSFVIMFPRLTLHVQSCIFVALDDSTHVESCVFVALDDSITLMATFF